MAHEVKYISYRGNQYPVRISFKAIKRFQLETGKDIKDLDKDFAYLETLLWFGLLAGHKAEDKELTLKREEMEDVLDESMNDFNDLLVASFPLPGEGPVDPNKKK
jgi:hypothetical protein